MTSKSHHLADTLSDEHLVASAFRNAAVVRQGPKADALFDSYEMLDVASHGIVARAAVMIDDDTLPDMSASAAARRSRILDGTDVVELDAELSAPRFETKAEALLERIVVARDMAARAALSGLIAGARVVLQGGLSQAMLAGGIRGIVSDARYGMATFAFLAVMSGQFPEVLVEIMPSERTALGPSDEFTATATAALDEFGATSGPTIVEDIFSLQAACQEQGLCILASAGPVSFDYAADIHGIYRPDGSDVLIAHEVAGRNVVDHIPVLPVVHIP
jgi:hypothetical protein